MSNDIPNIDRTVAELRSSELEKKSERPGNDWWAVSIKRKWGRILLLAVSALLFSSAFPPLNLGFLGWVAIIPLFLMVRHRTIKQAWIDGFIWGYAPRWGRNPTFDKDKRLGHSPFRRIKVV